MKFPLHFHTLIQKLKFSQLYKHYRTPIRVDPGEEWINPVVYKSETEKKSKSTIDASDMFQLEMNPVNGKEILKTTNFRIEIMARSFISFSWFDINIYSWFKRKRSGRDIFRQKQANLKKQMKDAISYKDSNLFFKAARERIRLEIGTLLNIPTLHAI